MMSRLHDEADTGTETESVIVEPVRPSLESLGHDQELLGGLTRACNMLIQAERLYAQQPTHQNEVLLKTARRLLSSLQAEASGR